MKPIHSLLLLLSASVLLGCAGPEVYKEPSVGPTATITGPSVFRQSVVDKIPVSAFMLTTQIVDDCFKYGSLSKAIGHESATNNSITTVKIPANQRIFVMNKMKTDFSKNAFILYDLAGAFSFYANENVNYFLELERKRDAIAPKLYTLDSNKNKIDVEFRIYAPRYSDKCWR